MVWKPGDGSGDLLSGRTLFRDAGPAVAGACEPPGGLMSAGAREIPPEKRLPRRSAATPGKGGWRGVRNGGARLSNRAPSGGGFRSCSPFHSLVSPVVCERSSSCPARGVPWCWWGAHSGNTCVQGSSWREARRGCHRAVTTGQECPADVTFGRRTGASGWSRWMTSSMGPLRAVSWEEDRSTERTM